MGIFSFIKKKEEETIPPDISGNINPVSNVVDPNYVEKKEKKSFFESLKDRVKKKKEKADYTEEVENEVEDKIEEDVDEPEEETAEDEVDEAEEEDKPKKKEKLKKIKKEKVRKEKLKKRIIEEEPKKIVRNEAYERILVEIERLKVRLDTFDQVKAASSERFTRLSEQIGELRTMIIDTEKKIRDLEVKATMAADLVKEVQPEKLMTDVQKLDAKIEAIKSKLDGYEAINNSLFDELKNIRSKMSLYRGVDGVIKLSEEIKKDLINIQKIKALVEGHSDKIEQIFIDVKKDFADFQKVASLVSSLEGTVEELKKDMNNVTVKTTDNPRKEEFDSLRENVNTKLREFDRSISSIDEIKHRLKEFENMFMTLANNVEKNERILGKIGPEDIEVARETRANSEKIRKIMDLLDELTLKIGKQNEDNVLVNYIREAINEGYTEQEIINETAKSNWPRDLVLNIINKIKNGY